MNALMNAIPSRVKTGFVAVSYAAVIAFAAVIIAARYVAEQRDPATFNGGMGAAGDWFLELFLVGLLLIPTLFLALIIRDSETAYTKFAKVLLGISVSAPVSIGLMAIPAIGQANNLIGYLCLYRTFAFPMTLVGFAGCCILAKYKRPRRLILYSLLIEIATFVLLLALNRF